MIILWTEKRANKNTIHHLGYLNKVYVGFVSVIHYRDGTAWVEANPKFGKESKPFKKIDLAKKYIEKCARDLTEKYEGEIPLLIDLREPEYRCERCDDIYNVFRYKNRDGRCKCGGEILRRYPHVG